MKSKSKYTVLIADPKAYWTSILASKLNPEQCNVLVASDGLRALQILDSQAVDLLICELEMPEILGHQLIRMARKKFDASRLPIIIYTNQPRETWQRDCTKHCQVAFLKYETEVKDLAQAVEKVLNVGS